MQRPAYCADPQVRDFVRWVTPFVTGEHALRHGWSSKRWGPWACGSLYDAFVDFKWPFSVTLPGELHRRRGCSLEDNVGVLDQLSFMLRESAARRDDAAFLDAAIAVVDWGGIPGSAQRLEKKGLAAVQGILDTAKQLDPAQADLTTLSNVVYMNASFSKIYALPLDAFPIYDSRVATALASLVRDYCEENKLGAVPTVLALCLPPSRNPERRDPSVDPYRFHRLRADQRKLYAESNLMAAWLLDMLANLGRFGELSAERRHLALQSALFMVGYEVPNRGALGKLLDAGDSLGSVRFEARKNPGRSSREKIAPGTVGPVSNISPSNASTGGRR